MFYLITYGTLMSGNSRNYVMKGCGAELIKESVKLFKFKMLNFKFGGDAYPVLLTDDKIIKESKKDKFYIAEIWECSDKMLLILDSIEGVNSQTGYGDAYIRVNIANSENDIPIYIYVGNKKYWDTVKNKYLSECEYGKKWRND